MRALVFTVASLVLLAPAARAQTPAQLLVGAWQCSAPVGEMVSSGALVYNADGTSTFDQTVSGPVDGAEMMVRIVGKATWTIEADGKLTDRILEAEAVEGTIGDQPLSARILAAFEEELLANGVSSSDFTVSQTDLHISDGAGGGSTCKR